MVVSSSNEDAKGKKEQSPREGERGTGKHTQSPVASRMPPTLILLTVTKGKKPSSKSHGSEKSRGKGPLVAIVTHLKLAGLFFLRLWLLKKEHTHPLSLLL